MHLFQCEYSGETILMKMTSICMKMKLHACRTHFRTSTRFEREAQENLGNGILPNTGAVDLEILKAI